LAASLGSYRKEKTVGLKFGFLFSVRNPGRWQKPWPQVYDEMLEQVQAAEELGFDSDGINRAGSHAPLYRLSSASETTLILMGE
jgi:alkanesulfonate monooxygenase SsuD/methylene tetrahydromethanopterin reductase-like flavin-dependent oxidoreductase (luciferase family)